MAVNPIIRKFNRETRETHEKKQENTIFFIADFDFSIVRVFRGQISFYFWLSGLFGAYAVELKKDENDDDL